jgi:putative FmdB family regulatory protein
MPIYEYECAQCGCFEHSQSIHDAPLTRCPKCRKKVERLISASSFHLKGGGWYSDGYAKKSKSTDSSGSDAATPAAKAPEANGSTEAAQTKAASPPAGKTKAKAKAATTTKPSSD